VFPLQIKVAEHLSAPHWTTM